MAQVIEMLRFAVEASEREAWSEVEHRVWTGFLKTVPGFLHKELWVDDAEPDAVTAVIWWESREHWSAVTAEQCDEVDRAMGEWLRPCTLRTWCVARVD
jgi:uncharacterized protein (TIGR03792 family)